MDKRLKPVRKNKTWIVKRDLVLVTFKIKYQILLYCDHYGKHIVYIYF